MEQERIPVPGEFYRHFTNKLYQIKAVAYHSETKEKMVVYQAMYGNFEIYVRPYDMFMSEVDHIKYPEVLQKYRFERVDLSKEPRHTEETCKTAEPHAFEGIREKKIQGPDMDAEYTEREQHKEDATKEQIDPRLERFLDAETYQDKLNVITGLRDKLDDWLITAMAISIDAEVAEGPLDRRYESLRNCIKAHIRYETERVR